MTSPDDSSDSFLLPTPEGGPAGWAAEAPSNSTLLIPFADVPAPPAATASVSAPDETVTRLVDRMETLQRIVPNGTPRTTPPSASPSGSVASPLLLRLARIPSPPTATSALEATRRCNDCGDPLGSPPHFEPCGECGRALCERCYWKTSSGPQAHLCAACILERSVPRPAVAALNFPQPGVAASSSGPSSRPSPPRRRVS